jgi:hypothetical protein
MLCFQQGGVISAPVLVGRSWQHVIPHVESWLGDWWTSVYKRIVRKAFDSIVLLTSRTL